MLVHCRVTPSIKFAGTHLYTWVERGTVRLKCLAKNTTQWPRAGLEPGPLDPETIALTMRPPRLQYNNIVLAPKSVSFSVLYFIIWLCLTRTVSYKIHEFDLLKSILKAV